MAWILGEDDPATAPPARVSDFSAGVIVLAIFLMLLLLFATAYDASERASDRRAQPGIELLREMERR